MNYEDEIYGEEQFPVEHFLESLRRKAYQDVKRLQFGSLKAASPMKRYPEAALQGFYETHFRAFVGDRLNLGK